jgi:enterochelin esterase-like enzyme
MKLNSQVLPLLLLILLAACSSGRFQLQSPSCEKPGVILSDRVLNPTQDFDISFQVYLPPCYGDLKDVHFPVIYLVTMPYEPQLDEAANTPLSLADRLIRAGKLPPVIIVIPEDTVAQGYHAALAIDLIPYVDKKYNTLRDRNFRGVGGISHGAGIAARMAFQFPELFGSLGVFSGGIAEIEKPMFGGWIDASANHPRVLISIGDQDGIMPYTQNLMNVLDSRQVPYELNVEPGGHTLDFWSAHMEAYLCWFAEAWEYVPYESTDFHRTENKNLCQSM